MKTNGKNGGMKSSLSRVTIRLSAIFFVVSAVHSGAFALFGPMQPWMLTTNGVCSPDVGGGPMPIGSGYRWNVPVLTYGFDQSFLNFFGSNGVAAVESAIQVLNELPPASQIVLTNYPLNSVQDNAAVGSSLVDLKSKTLSLLLSQLGLAPPTRNIYVLHHFNTNLMSNFGPNIEVIGMPIFWERTQWYSGVPEEGADDITNFVAGLNFDPESLEPSAYLNNVEFGAEICYSIYGHIMVVPYTTDPFTSVFSVADDDEYGFVTGLTRDDVGGLRYLLSTNTVSYETLLSGVQGVSTKHGVAAKPVTNGAWRPGVDKITFVRQPIVSRTGTFARMTNYFTDTFFSNGLAIKQKLQRVSTQPDFLFSAANDAFCTGTTNWINHAAMNNHPAGGGPGIIQPPVVIAFEKMGRYLYSLPPYESQTSTWSEDAVQDLTSQVGTFGSFDASTNAAIVYPAPQTGNISMPVRVLLSHSNNLLSFKSFEWNPTALAGTVYAVQTSTNLSAWNTLFEVTNNGSVCTYQNVNANSTARFYRLIQK